MELLSRTKVQDVHLDLDSTAGISGEQEEIRFILESGGEAAAIIRRRFNDGNGEPITGNTKLYRDKETNQLLSAKSCFRCLGCHAYFGLESGKEINEPETENAEEADGIESDSSNPLEALAKLVLEDKPRSGFCEPCFKKKRRKRILGAIRDFLLNPLKAIISEGKELQNLPTPVIIIHPERRQHYQAPYPQGNQSFGSRPPRSDYTHSNQQEPL